jgi:hypothetical protein
MWPHVPRRLLTIEQCLTLLAETPRRIAALTARLTPAQLRTAPDDGWSANDVLAHLRACADVRGGCVMTIVAEDHPTLVAVDPRRWIKQTDYLELEFAPSFRSFDEQRAELLAVLEALPPEGWSRTANVKVWGQVLERAVLFYAQWVARHERSHYKQFERIVTAVSG